MLATLLSFFFFAAAYRTQPFRSERYNFVKVVSEFQIFGIMLTCVVLQTNARSFDTELIGVDDYGFFQVILTVAIIPVALYHFVMTARDVKRDFADDMVDHVVIENPLAKKESTD